MKKICYFINSDWYFELHWLERAKKAKEQGYEVHIITNFLDDKVWRRFDENGFHCHDIKIDAQSFSPLNFLSTLFLSRKTVNKIKPNVLHCITIKACLIGGLIAKANNIPVILSFVGLGRVFMDGGKSIKCIRKIILSLYRFIVKNKKCTLMFEHEDDKQKLLSLLKVNGLHTVIINGAGVNPDVYRYSLENTNVNPVVLFASRLLWSKGIGDLVEVKKRLQSKGVIFELKVAGIITADDPDAVPLTTIDEWNKAGLITWLGHSNNVYELIKDSNIVALPSVYAEGIPRILLEACSVGRSCIAYDVGGCHSLIRNNINGVIVPKKDIDNLECQVEYLINNPKIRMHMGIKGRQYINEKFTSEIILRDTLAVYQSLM
ncbi:glycosyltransferase [Enterobacteriaceae bacterium RIT691]|nr:glycosyltransferase [Enterobacteriaceae bacterium RIT691]